MIERRPASAEHRRAAGVPRAILLRRAASVPRATGLPWATPLPRSLYPRRRALMAAALTAVALQPGCTLAPRGNGGLPPDALPPPGYGTLRQEEVSITLTSGALQLMVTPLDPSVTHVTAPDTYRRLSGLLERHAGTVAPGAGASLFLVSFYSDEPDVRFVPEEVQLISHGIRVRPAAIEPVTPTWGERRVGQRSTEMAIYRFAGEVDLESTLVLAYGLEQTSAWDAILPRIRAERARARARAGLGEAGPALP